MSASVYILFSRKMDRYYIGLTTVPVKTRLEKHRTAHYGKSYTSQATDWEIVMTIACNSFSQARKMELYIKGRKSRGYISRLVEEPATREALILKFS